jgi:hypothetical protein
MKIRAPRKHQQIRKYSVAATVSIDGKQYNVDHLSWRSDQSLPQDLHQRSNFVN